MLFSTIYAFALLVLSTVVLGGKEHCIVPGPLCRNLNAATSTSCSSLISKSALSRPICTSCSSTIVRTTKWTITKTVRPTRTIWVTKPTVAVITRTSVVTRLTTRVISSTTWTRRTTTSTTTRSTTTTLPPQTCLSRRALDPRQAAISFPEICSCYLTTTRNTGIYTMILTTFPNATVTTSITATVTSTRLTTTRTSQTVSLRTVLSTTTRTTWRTSTSIIVSTRTAPTVKTFAASCTAALPMSSQPATANLEVAAAVAVRDFKECCNRCFAARGCNSYEYRDATKACYLRYSKQAAGCETSYCPRGKQIFNRGGKVSGRLWGAGPCYDRLRT
ncbi:hypothetical protein TWF281_004370 [Arthrobotrys megalospora]